MMTADWKLKIGAFAERALPAFFLLYFFANPFAKVVASLASSACMILFLARVFLLKKNGYRTEAKRYYQVLLIYIAAMAAALLYTPDLADGVERFQGQITKLLLAIILIETVVSTADARKYLDAAVAGGVVLAAITIYQGVFRHIYRPPTMWNSVHGGNLLLFSLVAMLVSLLYEKQLKMKVLYVLAFLFTFYAFYLNGTRGAWFALACVLLTPPFIMKSVSLRKKIIYCIVLLAVAGVVSQAPFFKTKVREIERYAVMYEHHDAQNTLGLRLEMWKASGKMFLRNPVLGVGLGGWNKTLDRMAEQKEAPDYILHYNQTHNIYLDALSTRGLVGFLTFLVLIFYPVVYAWKKRGPGAEMFSTFLICATVAFLVSGMTDTLVYIRGVFVSYITFVGLSLAVLVRHASAGTAVLTDLGGSSK